MFSYLDALNLCLDSVGQLPVTSEDVLLPAVISARSHLDRAIKITQAYGYWFNIDQTVTLSVDTSGEVPVPSNALRIEVCDDPARAVVREGKLYDTRDNTFQWATAPVVTLVTELEFQDIPVVAQAVIMYTAASQFQINFEGDGNKYKDLTQHLLKSQMDLTRERTRWSRVTHKQNPTYQRYIGRMRKSGGTFNPTYPGGRG